jgi:hypothetical protein
MYESVNIVFQILSNLTNLSFKNNENFDKQNSKANFYQFFDSLYT